MTDVLVGHPATQVALPQDTFAGWDQPVFGRHTGGRPNTPERHGLLARLDGTMAQINVSAEGASRSDIAEHELDVWISLSNVRAAELSRAQPNLFSASEESQQELPPDRIFAMYMTPSDHA